MPFLKDDRLLRAVGIVEVAVAESALKHRLVLGVSDRRRQQVQAPARHRTVARWSPGGHSAPLGERAVGRVLGTLKRKLRRLHLVTGRSTRRRHRPRR